MNVFRKITLVLLSVSLFASYASTQAKSVDNSATDTGKAGDSFPDVISHPKQGAPVSIANIFPEHGLTDPHAMIVGDRLYVGMGHDQSWDVEFDWTMDRWEIWSTDDLLNWRKETTIEPNDTYFGPEANCWAGDFAQKDGKFYWYFSNRNFDTGVMVADQPSGPYKDALGKPLLPHDLAPTHSYDPDVFEENGVYSIIWGAGGYYMARLADDMLSLASEPKAIVITNPDGSIRPTDDKPTLFKRNEHYYLVWGADYAMSDKLEGPYQYKGKFYAGGHGSIFNWKGQWYVIHEHHDISMFYRGVMLKPMYFHKDGTVDLKSDFIVPIGGGRLWDFDNSRMGWRSPTGTDVSWQKDGSIAGDINARAIIESANWASADLPGRTLTISIKNETAAKQLKLSFAEFKTDIYRFWSYPGINWFEQASTVLDVKANSQDFVEYKLSLDDIDDMPERLKRLRIEFIGAESGSWAIDSIRIQ